MLKNILDFFKLSILDRYILKKYLSTTLFFLLIFISISVAIDYSEKVDDIAKGNVSSKELIIYFLCFIPHIASILLPIFVFIATIFFTSQLASRTEFIPMFCAGISMRRLLKPYVIGSLIVSGLLWIANFSWLPYLNNTKADFLQRYVDGGPKYQELYRYAIKIDSNKTLDIMYYDTRTNVGAKVSLYEFNSNKLIKILRADSLIWDSVNRSWSMTNVTTRDIRADQHKLENQKRSKLLTFITPEDFKYDFYLKEKLSKHNLRRKVEQETLKGSNQANVFAVELYKRDATPFSIIILSLIAAILASKKIRGGTGINIAIGFALSASMIFLERMSSVFSVNSNFPPLLAAWTPVLAFLFVIFYLFKKSQQ